MLLAVLSVLGLVGESATQPLIDNLRELAPGPARDTVITAVENLERSQGAAGILFVGGMVLAVWSASRRTEPQLRQNRRLILRAPSAHARRMLQLCGLLVFLEPTETTAGHSNGKHFPRSYSVPSLRDTNTPPRGPPRRPRAGERNLRAQRCPTDLVHQSQRPKKRLWTTPRGPNVSSSAWRVTASTSSGHNDEGQVVAEALNRQRDRGHERRFRRPVTDRTAPAESLPVAAGDE
jgi:hypothetical protein